MKRPVVTLAAPLLLKLFRHTIPKGHDLTLERRRIYALPTRHGVLFGALLAVMLLSAINYNNSLGFMLTFLLASLGLISILYTYRNIAHLRVRGGKAAPAYAGRQARFTVHLSAPEPAPRWALRLAAGGAAVTVDIPAGATGVEIAIPAPKRGRLPLGKITLSTTFPLGLVRAWAYVDLDLHGVVYPRPGPYRPLSAAPHRQPGERAGATEGSDDFLGFRAYHPGDSPRHIHWKAVARAPSPQPPLQTKRFSASEAPDLWLDWAALPLLDNEARLRVLCRWVLEAQRQRLSYGLRIPGVEIPPGHGAAHQRRCLEALALFGEPPP